MSDHRWPVPMSAPGTQLYAAGHRPQNFYMLGSMGLACPIALGVALAQPGRAVIAIEGDGSILMALGCLATIGMVKPRNLTIIIMDNGIYQITGKQKAATAAAADIVDPPASTTATGCATRPISRSCSRASSMWAGRCCWRPRSTPRPASDRPRAIRRSSAAASCRGSAARAPASWIDRTTYRPPETVRSAACESRDPAEHRIGASPGHDRGNCLAGRGSATRSPTSTRTLLAIATGPEVFLFSPAQVRRQSVHCSDEITDGIECGGAATPGTRELQALANDIRFRNPALAQTRLRFVPQAHR